MSNKKELIYLIQIGFLIFILSLFFMFILETKIVKAASYNENSISNTTRKLMVYNNLSVESSVLKAFEIENQTKILVVIKINETFNKNYDLIKSKILSNLTKEEFEFKGTISGSDWITGYLNLEGLEKLKNNPYVSIVHEEGKLSIQKEDNIANNNSEENGIIEKERSSWPLVILLLIIIFIFFYIIFKI